jgi:sensor histidine kinase YesM
METFFTNLVFSNARAWRVARHGLFWFVWISFLSWLYAAKTANETTRTIAGINAAYFLSYAESLLYLPCHLVITYTLLSLLIPRYLLHKRVVAFILGIIASYCVAIAASIAITFFMVIPLRQTLGFELPWNSIFTSFSTAVKGGSTIVGFAVGLKLLKLWYEKQRDNQLLAQKNLEAELESLKAQVHPHFLFNTLNSLYALTLTASPDAPEAVLRLAAMLRTMLYDGARERVALCTELNLIRNYIELELLRFGERVDVSLRWNEADAAPLAIAPLVLLPFVENAFKHGVSTSENAAWISLETRITGHALTFRLMNSKPEFCQTNETNEVHKTNEESAASKIPSGLGLANVRKRLELLYPNRHALSINDEGEMFIVVLTVELHIMELHAMHTDHTASTASTTQPSTKQPSTKQLITQQPSPHPAHALLSD